MWPATPDVQSDHALLALATSQAKNPGRSRTFRQKCSRGTAHIRTAFGQRQAFLHFTSEVFELRQTLQGGNGQEGRSILS